VQWGLNCSHAGSMRFGEARFLLISKGALPKAFVFPRPQQLLASPCATSFVTVNEGANLTHARDPEDMKLTRR
jgi:hypothetical protein